MWIVFTFCSISDFKFYPSYCTLHTILCSIPLIIWLLPSFCSVITFLLCIMFYLYGFPDNCQAEKSDQHSLVVEDTVDANTSLELDAEAIHKKNLKPDEKVLHARHWWRILKYFNPESMYCIVLLLQKISRNKACPCGSKKKYKSCCGAVSGRSSARFPVYVSYNAFSIIIIHVNFKFIIIGNPTSTWLVKVGIMLIYCQHRFFSRIILHVKSLRVQTWSSWLAWSKPGGLMYLFHLFLTSYSLIPFHLEILLEK